MNSSTLRRLTAFRKTFGRIRGLQIFNSRQAEMSNQRTASQTRPLQLELDFSAKRNDRTVR